MPFRAIADRNKGGSLSQKTEIFWLISENVLIKSWKFFQAVKSKIFDLSFKSKRFLTFGSQDFPGFSGTFANLIPTSQSFFLQIYFTNFGKITALDTPPGDSYAGP